MLTVLTVTIFAHNPFVDFLVKPGDLDGEPRNSMRPNLADEDGVNTVDGQPERLGRESSTAESTETDVNPSMPESSWVEQVHWQSHLCFV